MRQRAIKRAHERIARRLRIHSEFNRSLADWTEEFTSWFDRRVLGIERVL